MILMNICRSMENCKRGIVENVYDVRNTYIQYFVTYISEYVVSKSAIATLKRKCFGKNDMWFYS